MQVPAQHAVITDTCRANRGDAGALEEALARVRRSYFEVLPHQPAGTNIRIVLLVERPDHGTPDPPPAAAGSDSGARGIE